MKQLITSIRLSLCIWGGQIKNYLKRASKKLKDEIRKRIYRFRFRRGFLNTYQELFRILIIFYTTLHVFKGNFEVGIIALVLLYFNKIRESAGEFAQVANDWVIAKIAIMRMKDILNEIPSIEQSGKKAFDKNWKKLSIKNLYFSYGKQKVFKDFSLTIKRGERIGIVGLSGQGKSTLFKLLLKHYDSYEGAIFFDKNELKTIKISSFLKQVAVVPQDTELFNLTLSENITISPRINKKRKAKTRSIP